MPNDECNEYPVLWEGETTPFDQFDFYEELMGAQDSPSSQTQRVVKPRLEASDWQDLFAEPVHLPNDGCEVTKTVAQRNGTSKRVKCPPTLDEWRAK